MSDTSIRNPVEITIPVPWGHIAGKVWGDSSHQRVLALHGKQDNCAVFDRLIGLLKGNYYIVAIDLPGHGFSSHFPSGIFIHMLNYIHAIVDVVKHLNWDRFYLLAHSLGGQIGILFNALLPDYLEKFILIDHIAPANVSDEFQVDHMSSKFREFLVMRERLKKGKSPVYTYVEALHKLTNRDSSLTVEAAEIVSKRSLRKFENGYSFCMDQRLKLHPYPELSVTLWNNMLQRLKCPTLLLFSSERYEVYKDVFQEHFKCIEKKSNVTEKIVFGNHDVHQNHPERVAPFIDEFFSQQRRKSWNVDCEDHILMVHGVQHNCGAFDRLIRLLKNRYHIIAIDLPSHGRSSHFPQGTPLELIQFVLALKRVINYFAWEKFSLVGHSFGGQTCTYFTAIFPQGVQSLVVIDTMEPRPVLLPDTLTHLQSILNQQLELEDKLSSTSPPVYTYQEAYKKVKKNMIWELNDEAAKDLMDRAVVEFNGGYTFASDQRLKNPMRPILTFEQQKVIVENISCPVLFIIADGNMTRYNTYLKDIFQFNSNRDNNTIIVVKGDHAVHQNYPERISSLIDGFLTIKNDKNIEKNSQ